jgi:pyridoxal phosphate enzyme (YggS family)
MSQEWKGAIQPRLEHVRERITNAAERSGRPPETIQLIAITKGHPIEAITAAFALGLNQIGENRVEEALRKQELLSDPAITWHMVGHIQSRKAADIPGNFSMVHSIDRMKIAERISRFNSDRDDRVPILLECNVSGESTKAGWNCADPKTWPAILPQFAQIAQLPGIEIRGLMTMAPWVQDETILRSTFKSLRTLKEYLSRELTIQLPELSMGMTDDYEIAVEEGATMLRLGRALFGERL